MRVVTAEVSWVHSVSSGAESEEGASTPTSSLTRWPVETSVTRAWSLRVETSQVPSPERATLPPVWMGSYVRATLKL